MTARAMYKARLCLNAIEVPVKFYAAVQEKGVSFRLLHATDLEPVNQELIDKTTGRPVSRSEIQKAYPSDDHRLVKLQPGDLEALEPDSSRKLSVTSFVDPALIDHRFYDRPYYLGPDGEEEDYFALCRALQESKCVGLVHYSMRKRGYVGALREQDGYLMIVNLRHVEEVVDIGAFSPPDKKELSPEELRLARQLVDALKGPFEPQMFQDDYRKRVQELIARKASGKVIRLAPRKKVAASADLTDALKNSLKSTKKRRVA